MLLNKKQAVQKLRLQAGYSRLEAERLVGKLARHKDGRRDKFKSADVQKIISKAIEPTPEIEITIRPFRKSIIEQIQGGGRSDARNAN